MLDPFTHPVVCAVLEARGGQPLSLRDGTPVRSRVPDWAHHPLRELTWGERTSASDHQGRISTASTGAPVVKN